MKQIKKEVASVTKEDVEKMFEITVENAVRDMKLAKMFFITKNGKFYSSIANSYIDNMRKYIVYCNDDGKKNLIGEIEELISLAGEMDEVDLMFELYAREHACKIMNLLSNGASWNEIKDYTKSHVLTNWVLSYLGQVMLRYSPQGIEFVDNIIGKKHLRFLECLNEEYVKQKEKQKVIALNKV